jgi:hypothetical protein
MKSYCECGGAKLGLKDFGVGHSDWCDAREGNEVALFRRIEPGVSMPIIPSRTTLKINGVVIGEIVEGTISKRIKPL